MKYSEKDLEEVFDTIQIGHSNAINPPKEMKIAFKKFVDQRNLQGDIVIRSRNGYYRPFPLNDIDSAEFSKYISQEYQKGMQIIDRCNSMTKLYSEIEKFAVNKWKELDFI